MKNIFKNNIVLSLCLGLCPILAVSNNFESAYLMGICVLVVLLLSNTIISLIRKLIPENIIIPSYILIIATLVTVIEILVNKFMPDLYNSIGLYLSLITVNCVIFGRAISYASKNTVFKSIIDALTIGIGYLLVISFIGLAREFLGNNTITLIDKTSTILHLPRMIYRIVPNSTYFPINLFQISAGGFIILGIIIAIFNKIKEKTKNEWFNKNYNS